MRKNIGQNEFNDFAQLESDEKRFEFINALKSIVTELKLAREFKGKNLERSLEFKNLGNKAFQKESWTEALAHYNLCYLATPEGNGKWLFDQNSIHNLTIVFSLIHFYAILEAERAIILANRSAALYHLEKYDQALKDIQRAIDHNYPKDLMYKLMERKARCYLGKKDHVKALQCFK